MSPVSVTLRNDYEVVVRGLERMLEPFADRIRVIDTDVRTQPDVSVDVTLHDTFTHEDVDTDEHLGEVIADPRSGRVVVFSWNAEPEQVDRVLRRGAAGFVDKGVSAEDLVEAIERIAAGETVRPQHSTNLETADILTEYPGREHGLSPREAEVLALITLGLTNEQITQRCYLTINTVKSYIRNAYRKIGVTRRAEAVRWGMENGLLPGPRH